MKQLKKLILILIISMLFSLFSVIPVFATNELNNSENSVTNNIDKSDVALNDVNTKSQSCLLIDAKTGDILYAKNAFEKMYPASTTKIMTAILVLEKCQLSDIVTVSHNAIYSIPVGYSHASLKEGEELTVEQLLNVLMIPSANDAAIALAEYVAGSVENFSAMMNEKAKELGCINTNFVNPNGVHDKNHYSCSYDLGLIGKYAMTFPDIMRIAKVRQYTLPTTNKYDKTDRIFNATNALLNDESLNEYYYPYATGLKTGYTDSSGSCIVATSKKDDIDLLVVILKADSISSRYDDCKKLFDYGFDNYSYSTLQKSDAVIKTLHIENATDETKSLNVVVKDDIKILIKNSVKTDDIEPIVEINADLKAPIAENSVLGKITYTIDRKSYSSDLIAGNNVIPSSFEVFIFRLCLIFLILLVLYQILKRTGNSKPKKKIGKKITKKKKKSNKNSKSNKGNGKFKFTQISDYLK